MPATIEAWQAVLLALISAGASFAGAWGGLTVKLQWLRRDVDDAHSRLDELGRMVSLTNQRVDNAHVRIDEQGAEPWDGMSERRVRDRRQPPPRRRRSRQDAQDAPEGAAG